MTSFEEKGSQTNRNQFNKLVQKNLRLENELLFANKCIETLITFKSFVDFISNKFKYNLNTSNWKKFEELKTKVEEVLKSRDELKKRKTNKKLTQISVVDIDGDSSQEDVEEVPKPKDQEIERTTEILAQKLVSYENVIDIEEDNCETESHSLSSNSAFQQSLSLNNKKSAQNEINSNNGIKTNKYTIHSSEENTNTIETNSTSIQTLYSDNEMTPKALYKSNITYNRRQQSNNCSQNTDKSVYKTSESSEEMTDPTTTQTIKTEIISYDKTEENIKFEYLSQNLRDFENTYNSINLSESQFSTKDQNNEQNIGFVDTNDSEEQTFSNLIDREKKLYNIYHELEGPVIVNIKPSNSSTEQKINSVFKCPIIGCNKWMTIDFIPKHSLEIHNQFVIICGQNKCKKLFSSAVKYDEHMNKHNTKDKQWLHFLQDLKNRFICDGNDCHKDFISEEELLLHKQEIHFVSKLEVNNKSNNTSPAIMCSREDCLQTFEEKLFKHHMIVFHKECTSVDCLFTDCSEKFNEFEEYMNHLLRHSSEFWSKYYPKIYYDLKVYKKHFISDKNESNNYKLEGNDSNKCDICGKVFGKKKYLSQHKKFMHFLKPHFKCDYPGCSAKYKYQSFLNSHKRTVHSLVKVKCNQCNKVFKHQLSLNAHKITHSEQLFACNWPDCQFQSKHKKYIKRHQKNHRQPESIYVCDWPECGKTFKRKECLMSHIKTHTRTEVSDKKYSCKWPGCQFKTAYSQNMSGHIKRIHRYKRFIEKPEVFECDWPGCQYTCKNKYRLKSHQSVHSSERKYLCDWPDCGKAYKHKSGFDEHMRTHNNDKRYSCDYPGCSYRCVSSSNILKHKRKHQRKRKELE